MSIKNIYSFISLCCNLSLSLLGQHSEASDLMDLVKSEKVINSRKEEALDLVRGKYPDAFDEKRPIFQLSKLISNYNSSGQSGEVLSEISILIGKHPELSRPVASRIKINDESLNLLMEIIQSKLNGSRSAIWRLGAEEYKRKAVRDLIASKLIDSSENEEIRETAALIVLKNLSDAESIKGLALYASEGKKKFRFVLNKIKDYHPEIVPYFINEVDKYNLIRLKGEGLTK